MNILIIDDEREVGNCLRNFLELSHEVTTFDNPLDIKNIDFKDFDSIIVDMKMPHMNGLEVLALAKKENPSIKSILMSGGEFPDSDLIDNFLSKPSSLLDLEEILED